MGQWGKWSWSLLLMDKITVYAVKADGYKLGECSNKLMMEATERELLE